MSEIARRTDELLEAFVQPLLVELDKCLGRTFLRMLQVMVQFRHRAHGLLLSDLGAYILSPDQAPAGTKRLSNLLRSRKWASEQIEKSLWRQAHEALNDPEAAGNAIRYWCGTRVSSRRRRVSPWRDCAL